jgi:hypothetical protein
LKLGKPYGYFSNDEDSSFEPIFNEPLNLDLRDSQGNKITKLKVKLTVNL